MSKKFSYEESITEVEKIIEDIENGNINIDDLSKKVQKATKLLKECKAKLTATQKELDSFTEE